MLVKLALWYLFNGAVVWMLMDAAGITARRPRYGSIARFLAMIAVIVLWPRFVWAYAGRGR